jgi:hypothetical protein
MHLVKRSSMAISWTIYLVFGVMGYLSFGGVVS